MKKLVLMFVAIAAISFASCGGNNKPAENADSTATDTTAAVVNDSTANDSTAAANDSTAAADTTANK